jgi:hypothetical protein
MPPFVNFFVNFEWFSASRMLGNDGFCATLIQVFDDPIGIKCLVSDQSVKLDIFNEWRDADCIEAVAGQQDEAHKIAQRVGQREDFGGHSAL